MKQKHIPVLLEQVTALAGTLNSQSPKILDLTAGRGGHLRALMAMFPNGEFVALDQDPEAIAYLAQEFQVWIQNGQLQIIHGNFKNLGLIFQGQDKLFDFILADLGVSSPQLDNPERGFSFYHDGPLDMRMNPTEGMPASDVVNNWSEKDLVQLFQTLGEVRSPYRVVRAICEDRKSKPFLRTSQLSGLIERVDGWRKKNHHPATQYFMALRLWTNEELSVLPELVDSALERLSDQGIFCVITFHSTEDRIVKQKLKSSLEFGKLINKKVLQASRDEQRVNPRSRSAKLRSFLRVR